jgi:hypothetical protein
VSRQKKQRSKVKDPSQHQDSKKRQGRRFFLIWLPVIIVFLLFFYVLVLDPPRPIGQPLPGTSRASEQAGFGDSGVKTYMVVLDDGRTVTLEGSMMGALESGRRVLVQENTTLIFKRKNFSFVRYLE